VASAVPAGWPCRPGTHGSTPAGRHRVRLGAIPAEPRQRGPAPRCRVGEDPKRERPPGGAGHARRAAVGLEVRRHPARQRESEGRLRACARSVHNLLMRGRLGRAHPGWRVIEGVEHNRSQQFGHRLVSAGEPSVCASRAAHAVPLTGAAPPAGTLRPPHDGRGPSRSSPCYRSLHPQLKFLWIARLEHNRRSAPVACDAGA
jgi:hypothetical protein